MDSNAPAASGDHSASGYVDLRERAVRLLAEAPSGLTDAELAGSLFGAIGGARWPDLLQTVLSGDGRLDHTRGRWTLAGSRHRARAGQPASRQAPTTGSEPDALPEAGQQATAIIALALATTGADPGHHRIAWISAVRRENGKVTARLDEPVSAGRRLPRYLLTATRGSAEAQDAFPSFAEIAPALREMTEGQIVHVYGAARARAFVDAELRRAELPNLDASFVELDDLLRELLPGARKPGLLAAATELGVPHRVPGLPLADAEAAARVVERLRERQAASPGRGALVEATEWTDPVQPLPFTRQWLRGVPEGPGVYVMEDAAGQALYVGKATALRQRLSAYVARQPTVHRQLEALAVRAATVTSIPTASDLETVLLEARLIRDRQPAFNVARQTRTPTAVIRAAPDERSPVVRLVGEVRDDGARYFGPFESVAAARQALNAARSAFPEAFARHRGDVERQRQAVLEVCRLLSGQKLPAVEAVQAAMREAARRGDRLEVDRLRHALRAIQQLEVRPSMLAGLTDGWRLLVLERPTIGPTRTHLLQDGRRLVSVSWEMAGLPSDPNRLRRLAADMADAADALMCTHSPDGVADDEVDDWPDGTVTPGTAVPDPDEPAIVLRWLVQAASRIEVARVPPADDR